MPDPNNYHEFCRLLARLKSNYQLGELVKVENYPEVIRLIANFTVTSLQVGATHWVFQPECNVKKSKDVSRGGKGQPAVLKGSCANRGIKQEVSHAELTAPLVAKLMSGTCCSVTLSPPLPLLYLLHLTPSPQHWEFAPNSVHYLLSLWQRLAASVPYVKATEPHLLETYTPEVTKAYITSRLESVHVILR